MPTTDPASPEAAWQNGVLAVQSSDYANAVLWLDRAARLAPDDPRIALERANARLGLGIAVQIDEAALEFADLTARYDIVPAWLGLVTAERMRGNLREAGVALGRMLRCHCIPLDLAFLEIAGQITIAAGLPGWCGLTPSGILNIASVQQGSIAVSHNGNAVKLPTTPDSYAPPTAGELSITVDGHHVLGSPLDLTALNRVEGVVSVIDGALVGWAYLPASPSKPASLSVLDASGRSVPVMFGNTLPPDVSAPFALRHGFAMLARRLKTLKPPLRVSAVGGTELLGSPVDPEAEARIEPVSADYVGKLVKKLPRRVDLAVVIPVYRGEQATRECLGSVFAAVSKHTKIIVVDDATPEPALGAWLATLASKGKIHLIRHADNLGFPAAANSGILAAGTSDILLLNSDTLVPAGAIEAITDAAYARANIGTATPFSNEATILGYPRPGGKNAMPDLAETAFLQALAAQATDGQIVEIPTCVGFCVFIRHDCLAANGLFRSDIFAQGYGEENDFSLRARQLGYRHVAATGAFVAHHGSVSFRSAGRALNARNVRILNRLYPGYDQVIADWIKNDPLAPARRRLDLARFKAGVKPASILLISHNHGGGVARKIAADMDEIRAKSMRPLLLVPGAPEDPKSTPFPWDAQLTDGPPWREYGLRFKLPGAMPALLEILRDQNVESVVLHHALGHHDSVRGIANELGVPQDIVLHDYASFCPRVNLLTKPTRDSALRYCGEPNLAGCVACVEVAGEETFENLGPARLVERSAAAFAAARRVIAPSWDTARRIHRHFPSVYPEIVPWEDDDIPVHLHRPGNGRRRVVVIGGIGPAKGFDLLIECANDARQRDLNLDFIVAGASACDADLIATGRIFVTGAYAEGEATKLVSSLAGDLAFLPSIWPETWCFALSEAWRAGLYVLAFDLGAQAARIKATNRGAVLPFGLPAHRINDVLLAWQPDSNA